MTEDSSDFDVGVRLGNFLHLSGLTLEECSALDPSTLRSQPNFGPKALSELYELLDKRGLPRPKQRPWRREAVVDFGEKMRELRESHGFSHVEMAAFLGVLSGELKLMETGHYPITITVLKHLLSRFDVTPYWLIFGTD